MESKGRIPEVLYRLRIVVPFFGWSLRLHRGAVRFGGSESIYTRDFPERFAATGVDLGKIPEVPNLAFGLVRSNALL